ncbi:MAG TPA: S41 family peptidase, partial [Porticoccaceae bacterium]
MKYRCRFVALTLLSLSCALATASDADTSPEARLPLEDLQLFVQIFDQIRSAYVEEVEDSALFEKAIEGLLSGLDPHSSYLAESDYDELQESTTGEFGGLGIEVGMEGGLIKVIAPIDDTPAYRAGIQPGDLIIKIDDNAVQGMSLRQAISLMRGPKGEPITLTVLRVGLDSPLEVTIVRDIIKVRSVRSEMLEDGIGFVRIAQFQTDTGSQFRAALESLAREAAPLRGVVIDLRNNPGGLLPAAIET